ncbi:MAG TPA: flavodoxin family protein [Deltaproteobacteria bacterium]|nr:flavodoxin family protein [Deltaproteobacteria bacterium]
MKILVAYFTKTGNTRKVAEAIHDAVKQEKPDLLPVKDVQDPGTYDLIICGFPVQAHSVPVPVQEFLKNLKNGQKLAIFSTHGSRTEGQLPKEAIKHAVGLARNVEILGSFTCRGEVEEEIIEALMAKPEHRAWAMEAASAKSHPDGADLEDARVFARNMVQKLRSF